MWMLGEGWDGFLETFVQVWTVSTSCFNYFVAFSGDRSSPVVVLIGATRWCLRHYHYSGKKKKLVVKVVVVVMIVLYFTLTYSVLVTPSSCTPFGALI